jgi:DNA-binding Lrp family transcriptional regulator
MTREELSEALTIQNGGIYTRDAAEALGVSTAKAWRALRELELAGVLEGFARDRHGDDVGRGTDGKPRKAGVEIQWFVRSECDVRSPESDAAAARILAAVAP